MIDFNTKMSVPEINAADKIVDRYLRLSGESRMNKLIYSMDLYAAHFATPLKLEELAEATDFDLAHDMGGIIRHIDRKTGQLTGCFLPRYARQ
jgi:hypothetical protein